MRQPVVINFITFFFILLFTYAAVSKIIGYKDFSLQLESFPYLLSSLRYMAWLIPGSELGVVMLLAFTRHQLAGFYASLLLLILFTIYLGAVLIFSPNVPCSCGGILQHLSWQSHIVFNTVCIALNIWGIKLKQTSTKHKSLLQQTGVSENL